jgi:hypothetical protein
LINSASDLGISWIVDLDTSKFGERKLLAGGTREKIRDAMGSVFNHAIRWEFTDRNPIASAGKGSGVRVSAKRERTPDILEVEEMHLLLGVGRSKGHITCRSRDLTAQGRWGNASRLSD